ncbi:cupin domain-containing protein [Amycolatopsis regifaucium]|uniref:Cupin n=1 Tax=Amycolatopsis regifaucium TaxID=546365 RepID=A0A154MWD5_9PSEU|nr:cupin [Amycolatopsis regifaucium]OKA11423.1 cupin [Amycolatopsis regifaucium]SFH42186.1 putative monooxygenase [Amycolatopsis regifaucium]
MTETVHKVHFTEVAANRRRGGEMRVTLSPRTVASTSGFGGVLWLEPGEYVSEHYHPHSEEFLHLVRGTGTLYLDGEPIELTAGDSLLVPIGARHRLVNDGTEQAHYVFHLSPLAPRPELGHVDTEEPPASHESQPMVGGAR